MEGQDDDDGAKKQDSLQGYLILILTDSNLPTGASEIFEVLLIQCLAAELTPTPNNRRLRCIVWA